MNSYDFDKYFPLQGTCFHCGRDLRYHTLEEIYERFGLGESVKSLANNFKVPAQAINLAINHNSTKPHGRTIAPMVRTATA